MPQGVNLIALDGQVTIQTNADFADHWLKDRTQDPGTRQSLFLLAGNNIVQGLQFHDIDKKTYPNTIPKGALSPGAGALWLAGSNVTITQNRFDDMYHGIGAEKESTFTDPGLGVNPYAGVFGYANVVITENMFGVYWEPIHLNGALEDSIIARNTFWLGASAATLALGVAGSRHLDVSTNTVDGTQTKYSQGLVGWRAGFFFPL